MNVELPSLSFWEDAYKEHGPAVLAFLRRRSRVSADAEDLLQETFVRAIRAERGLANLSKVRSYLFTTAQNLLINHLQRDQRVLPDVELEAIALEMQPENQAAPDDGVWQSEIDARVEEVVRGMPRAEGQAFRSAVLEKRSYDEVGSRHGWSRNQVKVYVYRARKRLLAELGDDLIAPRREPKK